MITRCPLPAPTRRPQRSPRAGRVLWTSAAGWRFVQTRDTPIYFINASAFNLLGADAWIDNLTYVNAADSYDGRHPSAFVAGRDRPPGLDPVAITNYLLRQPEVAEFIRRRGPGGKALFLMMDEETERLARRLDLEVCLPPAALRERLDSKVAATRLATAAGVASVPHVLADVESYAALRRVAGHLGPDLVVQLPHGDSGKTTFFISTAEDFNRHAPEIAAAAEVKVMPRIRCRPATLEACVTRQGTLVGPLLTELTGCPDLTPYRGGWCGNEWAAEVFSSEVRRQAQRAALALGAALAGEGYRGCFGLDFLLDPESGTLYLGELNPRLTGATPLTSQAALDRGLPPLVLYHLAEWLGIDVPVDAAAFNAAWLEPGASADWGQLILCHRGPGPAAVTAAPRSGIWQLGKDGTVSFVRPGWSYQAITGESEALFLRTADVGRVANPGVCCGRLATRGRVLTEDGRLTPRATAWVTGFRKRFATPGCVSF
jgi:hypothetical protein